MDLSIEVWDYNGFQDLKVGGVTEISDRVLFKFPSIHPTGYKHLNYDRGPLTDNFGRIRMSFLCASRSGEYRQDLIADLVDGEWIHATRILKDGIITLERVPANFPTNEEGVIEWFGEFEKST